MGYFQKPCARSHMRFIRSSPLVQHKKINQQCGYRIPSGTYVCYRPDVGYVQSMSFIAGLLLLQMEPYPAFVAFANIMSRPLQVIISLVLEVQYHVNNCKKFLMQWKLLTIPDRLLPTATTRDDRVFHCFRSIFRAGIEGIARTLRRDRRSPGSLSHRMVCQPFFTLKIFLTVRVIRLGYVWVEGCCTGFR